MDEKIDIDIKEEKEKKKKKIPRSVKIISAIIILIVLIVVSVVIFYYSRITYNKLDANDLGINDNANNAIGSSKVENIAIFGIDSRQNSWSGLSDTIMVISLDSENKTIKISSFMRDSLVYIDGHGYEKQTHAYSYGNAGLAVKTLNENYDLDVKEYVTVNFIGLEKIVDRLGGLKLNVNSNEISEINKYITNLNDINGGTKAPLLTSSGEQLLSGRQVVAYSRIRKVSNGNDAQRTDRQREVVESIIKKLSSQSTTSLAALATEFMPYVQTNFSLTDIIGRLKDYNTFKDAATSEFRYPATWAGGTVNGLSIVRPTTLETNVVELHKFIYGLDDYTPSDRVKEISAAVAKL